MSMDSIADFTLVVVRVRQDGFSRDLREWLLMYEKRIKSEALTTPRLVIMFLQIHYNWIDDETD